jgi:hypothetical protein
VDPSQRIRTGLIASVADNGQDEDVEEVRELVSSYIRKESCIILLTVACESTDSLLDCGSYTDTDICRKPISRLKAHIALQRFMTLLEPELLVWGRLSEPRVDYF